MLLYGRDVRFFGVSIEPTLMPLSHSEHPSSRRIYFRITAFTSSVPVSADWSHEVIDYAVPYAAHVAGICSLPPK